MLGCDMNIVIVAGTSNIIALDSLRLRGVSLVVNVTRRRFSKSGCICLNLESGTKFARKVKLVSLIIFIRVTCLTRIPISLYTPHLINAFSNFLAFNANLRSIVFLYDGLLNILPPEKKVSEQIKREMGLQASRLGLNYNSEYGEVVGFDAFPEAKTAFPDFVVKISNIDHSKNFVVEIPRCEGKVSNYIFFFDQPLPFDRKEIDKVISFLKQKINNLNLTLKVFLHPSQIAPSKLGETLIGVCGGTVGDSKDLAESVYRLYKPKVVFSYTSTAVINIATMASSDTECYLLGLKSMGSNQKQLSIVLKRLNEIGVELL